MTRTPGRRVRWQTLFIVGATAGLLWLFFRNLDLAETWRAMKRADFGLLAAAVLITFVTYALRAVRWLWLLRPLGPVRFNTTLRTTVIGFTATFLLPGRVGEVLRPYLLARREGLRVTSAFATVIIERLLDLVTVLLLFAVSLPLLRVDVSPEIEAAGLSAATGAVIALSVLFLVAGHPERLGRWAARIGQFLPKRAATALGHIVRTFAEGLIVLRSPGHLAAAIIWSLPVWVSIAVGIWLTSLAFDLTLPFVGAFLVMGYLAVGVSVPTPGGAGGFHYFYLLALTQFFGADRDVAAAAAIILHAVSFVPVTFVGLVLMWQDGLTLGGLRGMKDEARTAEQA